MKKLGLVLIIFLLASVFPAQASPDNPIGYTISGDVVEIWNPDTTYYFSKTNGAQWVENPDVYWTRNVFGFGYYNAQGDYNEIYSADDIGTFNREIESDYSTYVNATLWKDFTYNGYDLRLGIRYHLKVEDTDLSVIIYVKNRGDETIPYDIGFSWAVTDIDIPNEHDRDRIYINRTYYPLDGVYDVTFTDMKHEANGTIEYDAEYRISDYTEFLTLEWDNNIPYSVRIQGNGVQDETTVTWMVNAGIFQPGQEKQTTLYWADAEGDLVDIWALHAGETIPGDVSVNSTTVSIPDGLDLGVYTYYPVGVFDILWLLKAGVPDNTAPIGITSNGVSIWVSDNLDAAMYVYDMNGVYQSTWALNDGGPRGLANDGVLLYQVELDHDIATYNLAGAFQGNWPAGGLNASNTDPIGIETNGIYVWVVDDSDDRVYKYLPDGTYVSGWDLSALNTNSYGIAQNGTHFFVIDRIDLEVYVYEMEDPSPVNVALNSDAVISRNGPGWVNATVYDPNGVANLNTVTIQVTTTGDAENFTLRWTQAGNTFTEISDPDNIVTLGASVRVNINTTTDLIAFNFTMTGGTAGLCDVRLTTIDDDGLNDTTLFSNEFEFSYFNWVDEVYFFINSAFKQLGNIDNYMTLITAQVTALAVWFESSLTRIVELFVQQFTVINEVYKFVITWLVNMFAIVLNFSIFYQSILDGTNPLIQPFVTLGNIWDLIGYDIWIDAAPLFIFIIWISSVGSRGKQIVGGELQVFINDINTSISLISYFTGIFIYVVETVISRVYGLFDAVIPGILTG